MDLVFLPIAGRDHALKKKKKMAPDPANLPLLGPGGI
jgi:hypothetical protein